MTETKRITVAFIGVVVILMFTVSLIDGLDTVLFIRILTLPILASLWVQNYLAERLYLKKLSFGTTRKELFIEKIKRTLITFVFLSVAALFFSVISNLSDNRLWYYEYDTMIVFVMSMLITQAAIIAFSSFNKTLYILVLGVLVASLFAITFIELYWYVYVALGAIIVILIALIIYRKDQVKL
jgi:hypothetical protein